MILTRGKTAKFYSLKRHLRQSLFFSVPGLPLLILQLVIACIVHILFYVSFSCPNACLISLSTQW